MLTLSFSGGISRKPKEKNLSQDLIILLTIGGVPASFFLELVRKALDNVRNIFTTREIAFKGTFTLCTWLQWSKY